MKLEGPLFRNWRRLSLGCSLSCGLVAAAAAMLRKEKRTQPNKLNQIQWRKKERERTKWRQLNLSGSWSMKWNELSNGAHSIGWMKWRTNELREAARPFSNNTISFARSARLKLIELLKWRGLGCAPSAENNQFSKRIVGRRPCSFNLFLSASVTNQFTNQLIDLMKLIWFGWKRRLVDERRPLPFHFFLLIPLPFHCSGNKERDWKEFNLFCLSVNQTRKLNGMRLMEKWTGGKTYNPLPRNLKSEALQWSGQFTISSINPFHSIKQKKNNFLFFHWISFLSEEMEWDEIKDIITVC